MIKKKWKCEWVEGMKLLCFCACYHFKWIYTIHANITAIVFALADENETTGISFIVRYHKKALVARTKKVNFLHKGREQETLLLLDYWGFAYIILKFSGILTAVFVPVDIQHVWILWRLQMLIHFEWICICRNLLS